MKWLLWGLLSVLPLQWIIVAHTPLGMGRLNEVAALGFVGVVAWNFKARSVLPILRVSPAFAFSVVAFLGVWFAASLLNTLGSQMIIVQVMRLSIALAVAVVVHHLLTHPATGGVELLRWTALATALTLIAGLAYSMLRNGVNPAMVFKETVRTGDPEILQKELFRNSFQGFGIDEERVQGNIRHEVFGAVLLAMQVSAWAMSVRPPQSTVQRKVLGGSLVLGAVLLITSLSRSVIIATAVWPALMGLRALARMRLSPGDFRLLAWTGGALAAGASTGFGLVLVNRFTEDTSSYEARSSLYDQTFKNIAEHPLLGGVSTVGESSHNFLLDAWLRGGFFTFLAALGVAGTLIWLWLRLALRLGREPGWMVPVLAALAVPIVRMFTAGGGLIPPVGWIAIAFTFGVLAWHQQSRAERPADEAERNPTALQAARA